MHNLINKFENFSIEVLLEIFDHLSTNDCFNAFNNLNWKINSALHLSGLSIDLTSTSRQTFNELYKKIIFTNHYRQIRKLKISNDLTIGLLENFFKDYNLRDFKQLRSLTLIKPSYMTLANFALLIPNLKQLEHVSIDSNSHPYNFFQSVATSPSIKSCFLPGLEIEEELLFQSKIEYLTITVVDISILLNLLAVFPQLKYLNVSLQSTLYIDENCLPELDFVSCENLQVLRLQILENSSIDFIEVEYFFRQISFRHLESFSYNCTTCALDHIDIVRWNKILLTCLSTIKRFHFFAQIPYNSCAYVDIKQILNDTQTNLCFTFPFSLSVNYSHYIIHTDIYPKNYFDLSLKVTNSDQYINYDPISCDKVTKYSKVNSLIIDSNSISKYTMLPKNINHLHIQGENENVTFRKCLKHCSNQLLSLKIFGLPDGLPLMSNLRQLTIQQVMFNLNMVSKLSFLCPLLELLTIEINCIKNFGEILDHLRYKSKLTELKFIRVFSRDPSQTWASWLDETKQSITNASYEAKNLFLFIWL